VATGRATGDDRHARRGYTLLSDLMTISDEDFNRRQRSEITDLITRDGKGLKKSRPVLPVCIQEIDQGMIKGLIEATVYQARQVGCAGLEKSW